MHAIIVDYRAPVDQPHEIGRVLAMLHRARPGRGGPGLFQLPYVARRCGLRQHVLKRRAADRHATRIKDRRAARQRPVTAGFILDVNATVSQFHAALCPFAQQDRHQLPRGFNRLAPIFQNGLHLRQKLAEIRGRHLGRNISDDLGQQDIIGHGHRQIGGGPVAPAFDGQILLPWGKARFAGIARVGFRRGEYRVEHPPRDTALEFDEAGRQKLGSLRRSAFDILRCQVEGENAQLLQ